MGAPRSILNTLPPAMRAEAEAQLGSKPVAVIPERPKYDTPPGPSAELPLEKLRAAKRVLEAIGRPKYDGAALLATPPFAVVEHPTVTFTISGNPLGKPRMSQRDKWKKRPAVLRYRAWADAARASAPAGLPQRPVRVDWRAFIAMPKSWPKRRKVKMAGQLHQAKPDRDNIDKALLDSLWPQDSFVAVGLIEKRWEDGKGPRLEVEVSG